MSYPAEIYVYCSGKWVSISPHGISTIPLATATDVGGVKIGTGIDVAADGTISTKHFSGDYNDLTNKPIIAAPVQSDWNSAGGDSYILNKPVALSQFNNDLKISDFPNDALYTTVPQAAAAAPVQSIIAGANVAISDDGHGNITIASTGTGSGPGGGIASVSGSAPIKVVDGTTAPVISLNVGAGLKVTSGNLTVDVASITGLATVATTGSYNDLSDKPTIPTVPTLATVATTGDYADLINRPTIPAAQVQSDWNATTGLGVILNKPTIPAAQVKADWNSTTGLSEILNKPTIPTKVSDLTNDSAFVDKAGAAAAAPVQTIVAGTNVTVTDDGSGNVTVAASGSATVPDASTTVKGIVKLADATAITAGTAGLVVDAAQLKAGDDLRVLKAGDTMTGSLVVPDGTAAAPAVKFNDATGIYQPAANSFAVSTAGVERLWVDAAGQVQVTAKGSAAAPALGHGTAGLFFPAADVFGIATAGVSRFRISADGKVGVGKTASQMLDVNGTIAANGGSAASPSLTFSGDPDSGMFSSGPNTFSASTAGVERLRIKGTGSVRYIPLAHAPAAPEEGEVYFDSTTKKLRCYDGTAWTDLN